MEPTEVHDALAAVAGVCSPPDMARLRGAEHETDTQRKVALLAQLDEILDRVTAARGAVVAWEADE